MSQVRRFYRLTRPWAARVRRANFAWPVAVTIAVLTIVALIVVQRRQRIVHLGYELSTLVKERDGLQERIRQLQLEREVLTAPERIRALAKERGLQPPAASDIVELAPAHEPP